MAYADLSGIEVHQITQFKDKQPFLVQKKYSTLGRLISPVAVSGAAAMIEDQIGSAIAHTTNAPVRGDDTPVDGIDGDRRWVHPNRVDSGILIDNQDKLRMLFDPTQKYGEAMAMAMGRKLDTLGYSKFLGTNYTGKTGATSTSFSTSTQKIDAAGKVGGTGVVGTQTGLNADKIKTLVRVLQIAYALMPGAEIKGIIGARQQEDMYSDIEYINSDYTGNRQLETNEMKPFMGVRFFVDPSIPTTTENANTVRQCMFFVDGGFTMAQWGSFMTAIGPDIAKRNNIRIYTETNVDFTRTQEKMCVVINCLED